MLAQFEGHINNLSPAAICITTSLYFPKVVAKDPLKDAMLIFTDGSSNGRATYVVNGEGHVVQRESASAQVVEL